MISQGFNRYSYDSFVYFRMTEDESFVYLLFYVDDIFIVAKDKQEIRKVKCQLGREFEMKDLGEIKKIVGIEILKNRQTNKL